MFVRTPLRFTFYVLRFTFLPTIHECRQKSTPPCPFGRRRRYGLLAPDNQALQKKLERQQF